MSFWVWGVVVPPLTLLLYSKISPPPLFRCQKDATTPFLTKKKLPKENFEIKRFDSQKLSIGQKNVGLKNIGPKRLLI